jgi:transcription termination factor Rho
VSEALERSVLERKERDELHTIAEALGVKPGTRTKKADLIQTILVAAGVEPAPEPGAAEEKPKRTRTPRATKAAASSPAAEADEAVADETGNGDADMADALGVDEAIERATADGDGPEPTDGREHGNGSTSSDRSDVGAGGDDDDTDGDGAADDEPSERPARSEARPAGGDDRVSRSNGQSSGPTAGPQGPRSQAGPGNQQSPPPAQGNSNPNSRQGQGQGQGQGGPGGQPGNYEEGGGRRSRRRRGRDARGDGRDFRGNQEATAEQQYQGELVPVTGLLDLTDQGYGYVRTKGYLPSARDVYVSTSQAKRFALRKGDVIEGEARPPVGNEKYGALLRIEKVSGLSVDDARNRPRFDDLTPLFPDVKLKMEQPNRPFDTTARIIDIISPVGKGQRGLIVSPPKAGKTTVIKQIATSIEANNPDVHLMVLLVDERPEEVTDMRRSVQRAEVVASTFDRPADEHTALAELAIERAKRLVEQGQDVVIILDGITRLARAYNLSAPASGRLTSGGIDQAAIYPPKKFFGAARNIEEGGSLTILATALVETGSKADDVIFEEFKGTGNMELRLDRRLAERRIYPAIDVNASSTRHEELLFERKQLELVYRLRRVLNGLADDGSAARSLELLIEKLKTTKNNDEFLAEVAKAQGL